MVQIVSNKLARKFAFTKMTIPYSHMAHQSQTQLTEEQTKMENKHVNRPEYKLSTPTELGEKTLWTDCGVGFASKDGKGVNIVLNANPVNGKLYMKKIEPKEEPRAPSFL